MADNTPDPATSQDVSPSPITGDQAIDALNEAMAILPKKRLGCLRRIAKYCAVLAVLLALFVYWNLLWTPRLKISKETTYITGPLTSDGTRVDYFKAFEQEFYPPEMKTDDNGCRLIVRALGVSSDYGYGNMHNDKVKYDVQTANAQVYEKLGLDPAIKPTMTLVCPYSHLEDYAKSQGDQRPSGVGLTEPWTLDDFPMMESWLEENGPILDLLGEAVRKPVFCMPLVRHHPEAPLFEVILCHIYEQRVLARSLVVRANYHIAVGDTDGAIDDVIAQKRLGRHLQRQGDAVELLLGIAFEGMADAIGVAGNRESQPTNEQLRRFVDELRAVPPPLNMNRFWLADRYHELAALQAMAHDSQILADQLSIWDDNDAYQPGITTNLPLDWNIIMRRINASYDDMGNAHSILPPQGRSLRDLFLGARSRRVADYLSWLSPSSSSATAEASRRAGCSNNLRRIALAMLRYDHEHGSLPPAYTFDASGGPLHSWRVLLLPYLDEEVLFAKIRLDEPWDSAHNRQFHEVTLAVYRCLSATLEPGETAYSVVVGEHTAFRPGAGRSLDDFGMDLILVVERCKSVCWMDPASELTDEANAQEVVRSRREGKDGIGCEHPAIVLVGTRDGSTRSIHKDTGSSVLQSLLNGTARSWPVH